MSACFDSIDGSASRCCPLFEQSVFDCSIAVRSRDCVCHRRSVALIVLEPRYDV